MLSINVSQNNESKAFEEVSGCNKVVGIVVRDNIDGDDEAYNTKESFCIHSLGR